MPLWLFTARDKPGMLETRKATRPTHRDYINARACPPRWSSARRCSMKTGI